MFTGVLDSDGAGVLDAGGDGLNDSEAGNGDLELDGLNAIWVGDWVTGIGDGATNDTEGDGDGLAGGDGIGTLTAT